MTPLQPMNLLRFLTFSSHRTPQIFHSARRFLHIGDSDSMSRTFSQTDIDTFARLSGDTNPLHVDPEFVKTKTKFPGCVVHGVLLNSMLSAMLGTRFPVGTGSVYVSQTIRFLKPLIVNEKCSLKVTVKEIERRMVTLDFEFTKMTSASAVPEVVADGECKILVPK